MPHAHPHAALQHQMRGIPDSSEERDALSYNLTDLKVQVEELHKILAVKEDEIAQLRKRNDKMAQSIEKSHASEAAGSF